MIRAAGCSLIFLLGLSCSDDSSSDGSGGAGQDAGGAHGGSGADGGSAQGGSAGSAQGGNGADGGNAGSSGKGSGGSAGAESIPVCQAACSGPADCAQGASGLYDASHYACEAGVCRWTGCVADFECASLGNYVCRQQHGLSTCVKACGSAGDCGSGLAYDDADNYSCDSGGCRYTGCNSEAECDDLGAAVNADYTCADLGGGSFCFPECTTPSDCSNGQPGYSASNYECDQGACRYTGCNGDSECASLGNYVCR